MTFQYSKELIKDTIQVFKEEDNVDLSEETAKEYLDSMSQLFLALSKPNDKKEEIK